MDLEATLKKILSDLKAGTAESSAVKKFLERYYEGRATYKDLAQLAKELGKLMSKSLLDNITVEALPDGKVTQEIGDALIPPVMQQGYHLIAEASTKVQQGINLQNGLKVKAQTPEYDAEKVQNLVNCVVNDSMPFGKTFADAKYHLEEPTLSLYERNVVDDSVRVNAQFQQRAGLKPKIRRTVAAGCCSWCDGMGGEWLYSDTPKDVYRRHRYCECLVEYIAPEGAKKTNVWSKETLDIDADGTAFSEYTRKQSEAGIYENAQKEFTRKKRERIAELQRQLEAATEPADRRRIAAAISAGKRQKYKG